MLMFNPTPGTLISNQAEGHGLRRKTLENIKSRGFLARLSFILSVWVFQQSNGLKINMNTCEAVVAEEVSSQPRLLSNTS